MTIWRSNLNQNTIVMLKNAAPPRHPLFHPNTAHFQFKNFFFCLFCPFFTSCSFSKLKNWQRHSIGMTFLLFYNKFGPSVIYWLSRYNNFNLLKTIVSLQTLLISVRLLFIFNSYLLTLNSGLIHLTDKIFANDHIWFQIWPTMKWVFCLLIL
jgi:hypothetical protein